MSGLDNPSSESAATEAAPLPMVLHCPSCHMQHIDRPDPVTSWTNPPHRTHQCQYCWRTWRPADVATVGVPFVATSGKNDTWKPTIETADHVLHRPSGETWLVSYVQDGYLSWCGWPEGRVPLADCELVWKATPDERIKLVAQMARWDEDGSPRARYGRERLAEHKDDQAVDTFAYAMKVKLARARAKGRSGWNDSEQDLNQYLAEQLVLHLVKGNAGTFEDVANFAMMLHQRGADPEGLARVTRAMLRALVDKTWGLAMEDGQVPATSTADELIAATMAAIGVHP